MHSRFCGAVVITGQGIILPRPVLPMAAAPFPTR
jgi:hypothetical protein